MILLNKGRKKRDFVFGYSTLTIEYHVYYLRFY